MQTAEKEEQEERVDQQEELWKQSTAEVKKFLAHPDNKKVVLAYYAEGKSTGSILRLIMGIEANSASRGALRDLLRKEGVYREGVVKPPTEGGTDKPVEPPTGKEAVKQALLDQFGRVGKKLPIASQSINDMVEGGMSLDVIKAMPTVNVKGSMPASWKHRALGLYSSDIYGGTATINLGHDANSDTMTHEYGHHLDYSRYALIKKLGWDEKEFAETRIACMSEFYKAQDEATQSLKNLGPGERLQRSWSRIPQAGLKNAVSGYATVNEREWVAEATMMYFSEQSQNPAEVRSSSINSYGQATYGYRNEGKQARERMKAKCPKTFEYLEKMFTNGFKKAEVKPAGEATA